MLQILELHSLNIFECSYYSILENQKIFRYRVLWGQRDGVIILLQEEGVQEIFADIFCGP